MLFILKDSEALLETIVVNEQENKKCLFFVEAFASLLEQDKLKPEQKLQSLKTLMKGLL